MQLILQKIPNSIKTILLLVVTFLATQKINAQGKITGIIKDIANDEPIENVTIKNVTTNLEVTTPKNGEWAIVVKRNDLVEIKHLSYETISIRIKSDKNPRFYSLIMRPKTNKLMEIFVRDKARSYKADSVRSYETYKLILEKPGVDEMSASVAPVAMMSNKFRQEQEFKRLYTQWEQEKYVDYLFNPKQLGKWTGLSGDSLQLYMNTYRPTYQYLRNTTDYNYLLYLKESLRAFCPTCRFSKH